jgi:DNA polymerase-3 subunit alpha
MNGSSRRACVKFDFHGLKTLTVLQKAVELIRRRGVEIDLAAIPLDDPTTFAMLARARRSACSRWKARACDAPSSECGADRLEDLIALVALYRPWPMDNIPTYNRRKHGEEEPEYLHPLSNRS